MKKSHNDINANNTSQSSNYIDFEHSDIKSDVVGEINIDSITGNINDNNINQVINSSNRGFSMEEYYNLEEALNKYETTKLEKRNVRILLNSNNKIDENKLYETVLINNADLKNGSVNAINVFYSDATSDEIKMICNLIAKICNDSSEREIEEIANALSHLKIVRHQTSADCAAITENMVFYFNPTMISIYDMINSTTGKKDENLDENTTIFVHEIEHIKQYGSNDFNNENGLESGFFRQYDDIAVNSLWDAWVLEAAAELKMAEYLNTNTTVYDKKISYMKSYALSNIFDDAKNPDDLVNATFSDDLDSALKYLKIDNENDKMEFLKLLYSIQLTQYDSDEFWEYYEKATGKQLTDDERLSLKMEIRTDAVYKLTEKYYKNLVKAINGGKIKDVQTVFYMMKVWELDSHRHLSYTEKTALEHAKEFIIWHDQIQKSIFKELSNNSSLSYDEIIALYDNYHPYIMDNNVKTKNFRFYNLSENKESYISDCFDGYSVTYFTDNDYMVDYINGNKRTN